MADIDLTQDEADSLIAMPKFRTNDDVIYYPDQGSSLTIPLISADKKENFLLDINEEESISKRLPIKIALVRPLSS